MMQVTKSPLSSVLSIGWHLSHVPALNQSDPMSLMTQRIFLNQALVVGRPAVKIVLDGCGIILDCSVCVCGLKLDRSEKPVLICQKECLWWGANSQWLQLAVEERARERALQFYVGGCGKVPSCLMLTGYLSNWYDATALSLLCHIAWLQLPQYISWRKNCFKHFDSMRVAWLEIYCMRFFAYQSIESMDLQNSITSNLSWCHCWWKLRNKTEPQKSKWQLHLLGLAGVPVLQYTTWLNRHLHVDGES